MWRRTGTVRRRRGTDEERKREGGKRKEEKIREASPPFQIS